MAASVSLALRVASCGSLHPGGPGADTEGVAGGVEQGSGQADEGEPAPPPLILMVDDEPLVLDGMRRMLREGYRVRTASSAAAGLALQQQALDAGDPIDVIVSDMIMPETDGAQFLAAARRADPDSVRIILSGAADLPSAIAAINDSGVFRFLLKPCESGDLLRTLGEALELRRLRLAERELLERTLQGAAQTLGELLSLASPEAAVRSRRIKHLILATAGAMAVEADWQLVLAATLSQIGCIAVPSPVLQRLEAGQPLAPPEQAMLDEHPRTAAGLLGRIPRLDGVAALVAAQATRPDEPPPSDASRTQLAIYAATALHAAYDETSDPNLARKQIAATGHYDVEVVRAVRAAAMTLNPDGGIRRSVSPDELAPGMVLERDIVALSGLVLVRKGEWVTETMATRIVNFAQTVGVVEPIPISQLSTARRRPKPNSDRSAPVR